MAMKGIWRTNPGGDPLWPNWIKLRAFGVKQIYIPLYLYDRPNARWIPNTSELTPEYKAGIESQNFEFRTYNCWNWIPEYFYHEGMVKSVLEVWKKLLIHPNDVVKHMYNIEIHNSEFVEDTLRYHRQIFPHGPISWAMEGLQGGWFEPSLVRTINKDINCVAVAENFYGNMQPIGISKVRGDLIKAGIVPTRAKVFYAPPDIPDGWDGCILSEETI